MYVLDLSKCYKGLPIGYFRHGDESQEFHRSGEMFDQLINIQSLHLGLVVHVITDTDEEY